MRVVLDSNAIISALSFGGNPEAVLAQARRGEIELVTSHFILQEVQRVLEEKLAWSHRRSEEVIANLFTYAAVINPKSRLHVIHEDDSDNRILECAVDGQAEVIVTGDQDLLRLGTYQDIAIVSPSGFLSLPRRKAPE